MEKILLLPPRDKNFIILTKNFPSILKIIWASKDKCSSAHGTLKSK
jgi:hypothetical protein